MTMDGRGEVLGSIRRSLGVRGDEAGRRGAVRARLERPPAGLAPARTRQERPELIELFSAMLEGQGADVVRAGRPADAPEAMAGLLRDAGLPLRVRIGADPFIAGLPWAEAGVEVVLGAAEAEDQASASRALAGAAETGTLFLASGPDNPSTLNFLPESHFVVLAEEDVLGSYEDAWDRVRAAYGKRCMPRTINMISGPSRTADIEQTIVRGAHGPKQFAIVLLSCLHEI
jgi:L-lactate dehydrogenase complex protein LldG